MALTYSSMLDLQTELINFNLHNVVDNNTFSSSELNISKPTLIMFICNHCPYVKHVNKTIVNLANKFKNNDINFIAISSNDVINYPEDSPELMKVNAFENNFIFPYLYDESQEIAKKYDAACTPDFYLYDRKLKLIYRGQLDDSRPGNGIECNGEDLDYAINCLLSDNENNRIQKPSIGCNIKWK